MFEGAITALITPFHADYDIDFEALDKLIEHQIENGIQGIVPCGSTGEAITMTLTERNAVIEHTVKTVNNRVPVIAGTGGSSTAGVIEATRDAYELGADAALINTPAYNKPQQEGLYLHYKAIANGAPGFPVMLYNIPGRTAVLMETETVLRLHNEFPKTFVAYKDATANLKQTEEIIRQTDMNVLSGDDALTLPMMSIGAKGIVSVQGNLAPKLVRELSDHGHGGRRDEAIALNHKLTPLWQACFYESNPVPAKYGASLLDLCAPLARLPLAPISEAGRARVKQAMTNLDLL